MAIGFDALEDLLAVMQYGGGGVEGQRSVGAYFVAVPAGIGCPAHMRHVVTEVATEAGVAEDILTNGGCRGHGAWQYLKSSVGHGKKISAMPGFRRFFRVSLHFRFDALLPRGRASTGSAVLPGGHWRLSACRSARRYRQCPGAPRGTCRRNARENRLRL